MTDSCPSITELLQLRDDPQTVEAPTREHVWACPRCFRLLQSMPDIPNPGPIESVTQTSVATRAGVSTEEAPKVGQLWTAVAPGEDAWRYIVAVIGRPRSALDTLIVAPTTTQIEHETDLDLIAAEESAGYPMLIEVWNQGRIKADQLESPVGLLPAADQELLSTLHKAFVVGADAPASSRTGVPIRSLDDPRRRFRNAEVERFRPLWRPLREQAEKSTDQAEETLTVGVLIVAAVSGDEWDWSSLAEATQTERSLLDCFAKDKIDFARQSDVLALAKVTKTIGLEKDQVRQAVSGTFGEARLGLPEFLRRTNGGRLDRSATSPKRCAASSSTAAHTG